MRETLGVLRRGVWLILLLMVAAATGGIWHSSTRAKTYEATSLLVVRPVLAQASFGSGQFGIRDAGPLGLELSDETHARLITSGTIAERVAKALKLKTPPEELASEVKAGQTSEQLIGIRATSEQPRLAAALADAFADEYLASRREEATRVVEIAASELTREADEMQKRLDKLDADILKLAAEVAVLPAPVAVAVPPGGTPPPTASPQQAAERASKEASIRRFTTERNDVLVQVTTLRAKVQDLRLGRILSNGGEVVERAEVPEAPLGPGMPLIAVAASVLGGALGAAFLLLRRYFDTRVRTREDVIRSAPVPVLAVIPRPRRPRRGRPAASKGDPLYPAEAYRFLRANLVTRGLGSTLRRLAVISPIPSETRASVVANLAMECALAGLRTVVVCADLRRPGLQALFPQTGQAAPLPGGLPDHVGLTLVVRDIVPLENALLPTDLPNLFVVPSGPPVSGNVFASGRLETVLAEVARRADVVLIETPVLSDGTDAAMVALAADASLLVVEADVLGADALREAVAELAQMGSPLLGLVLDGAEPDDRGFGLFESLPSREVSANAARPAE